MGPRSAPPKRSVVDFCPDESAPASVHCRSGPVPYPLNPRKEKFEPGMDITLI